MAWPLLGNYGESLGVMEIGPAGVRTIDLNLLEEGMGPEAGAPGVPYGESGSGGRLDNIELARQATGRLPSEFNYKSLFKSKGRGQVSKTPSLGSKGGSKRSLGSSYGSKYSKYKSKYAKYRRPNYSRRSGSKRRSSLGGGLRGLGGSGSAGSRGAGSSKGGGFSGTSKGAFGLGNPPLLEEEKADFSLGRIPKSTDPGSKRASQSSSKAGKKPQLNIGKAERDVSKLNQMFDKDAQREGGPSDGEEEGAMAQLKKGANKVASLKPNDPNFMESKTSYTPPPKPKQPKKKDKDEMMLQMLQVVLGNIQPLFKGFGDLIGN